MVSEVIFVHSAAIRPYDHFFWARFLRGCSENLFCPEMRMKTEGEGQFFIDCGTVLLQMCLSSILSTKFKASTLNFVQINLVYKTYLGFYS